MPKEKPLSGAYEFTRAAHDELSDCMKRYRVACAVALIPTDQKGIWMLVVEAFSLDNIASERPICSWSASWPNSTAVSFEAFLYGGTHRLVRMVEAWASADPRSEIAASA